MKLRVANEKNATTGGGNWQKKKKKIPRQDFCPDTEGDRLTLSCVCVLLVFFFFKGSR